MKKRILSLFLALFVLIAAMPFGTVMAEDTATEDTTVSESTDSVAAEIILTEPDFPSTVTTYKVANNFPEEADTFRAMCTGSAKTSTVAWDPGVTADVSEYAVATGGTVTVSDGWATFTEGDTVGTFRPELVLKSLVESDTNYIAVDVDASGIVDSTDQMTARLFIRTTSGTDVMYATAGQTYYFLPEATEGNPNPVMEARVMTSSSSYNDAKIYVYPGEKGTFYFPETLFVYDTEVSYSNASNSNSSPSWLNGIYGDFSKFLTAEWRLNHGSRKSNTLYFEFRSCIPANNSIAFSNVRWMSENDFALDYNAEYIAEDFNDGEAAYTYWNSSNHTMSDANFEVADGVWKHNITAEDWTDEASTFRYGHTLNLGYPANSAFEALQLDVDFSQMSTAPQVQITYNTKNTNVSRTAYVRRFAVANGDIYAVWENGVVETIAVADDEWAWVTLPAGFKGTVVIPFETLRTMTVGGYTYDGTTVDLFKNDDINDYAITVDTRNIPYADKGDVVTYDNYGYLTTLKPVTDAGTTFSADAPIEVDNRITEEINTVEAWVKVPEGTAAGAILADKYSIKHDDNTLYAEMNSIILAMNASGNPVLYLSDGDGGTVTLAVSEVDLRTDKWTHIAFSKSETAVNCYINGMLKGSAELPEGFGDVIPYHALTVGHYVKDRFGTAAFGGEVSYLKLWSKTLTSSEILGSAVNEPIVAEGLISAYTLNGETALADIAGNYNLEVYNTYITAEDEAYAEYSTLPENGYTFAVLPDTQIAAKREAISEVGTYTGFSDMYDWLVANKDAQNIQFVMGVGDITNDDTPEEYALAKSNFDKLTAAGIPWSVVGGNHDFAGGSVAPNNTTNMNAGFPASELSTLTGFGGFMEEGKMDNSYYYVTVNETKYLILNLMCEPSNAAVEWGNQVCVKNKDCKIIVITHEYLTRDAEFMTSGYTGRNQGADVWNKLVSQHENIIMAIGGHVSVPDIQYNEALGVNGNKVINVLVDSQALDYDPSHNMVMLLNFSEDGSKVDFRLYSPTKAAYVDANNQFALEVGGVVSDEALPEAPKADYTYSKYHSGEIIRDYEWFVNDGKVSSWSDLGYSVAASTQFSWYNNMLKYKTADEFNIDESTGTAYEKDRIGITFKQLPNVVNENQTALSFYIDRSSATKITYLKIRFTCGGGTYQPGAGSVIYYVGDNGEITEFENGSTWSSVALPAGFKGTVVIPFTSFKTSDGNGDFIDTSAVLCETQENSAQLTMYIMEARANEEYIFNNITYLEEYQADDLVALRNGLMKDENGELIDVTADTAVDARDIVRLKKVLVDYFIK